MKYFTLIPAILLSLTSVNALASGYTCKTIKGLIAQLTLDPACNILQSKPDHFPDVTFLDELGAPNTCFSGQLTATLGKDNTPVNGTAYSGLTNVSALAWKAASVIQLNLKAGNVELGRVYTKDVIFDPQILGNTTEALAMVDGSKAFNGGHGGLEITGNALAGATKFTGVLCIEK